MAAPAHPRRFPLRASRGEDALAPATAGEGFAALDSLVTADEPEAAPHGVVRVAGGSTAQLAAVAHHLARRARARGRAVACVAAACDEPWRELGARLGAVGGGAGVPADPVALAAALSAHADAGTVLLVVDPAPSQWGAAVADELARRLEATAPASPPRALVVLLTLRGASDADGSDPRPLRAGDLVPGAARFDLSDGPAREEDLARWWDALAAEGAAAALPPGVASLPALEAWWAAARALPAPAPDEAPAAVALASPGARALLARVALAQRGLTAGQLARLGERAARDELLALGLLAREGRAERFALGAAPGLAADPREPSADACREVAALLDAIAREERDPWAAARAAELYARAGESARADDALARAVLGADAPDARADFWTRWERAAFTAAPDPAATSRRLAAAELALRVGDVERACRLARAAVGPRLESAPFAPLLALGRATLAAGDLPAAHALLARALERAPDLAARAACAASQAEAHFAAGALAAARAAADDALRAGPEADLPTRLTARNVLGKLHLAQSAWREAEAHFAADAVEAECAGDASALLRAQTNRAIAALSGGRYGEAEAMLAALRREGERHHEPRAVAFALVNLATLADLRHEYPAALSLWDEAFAAVRRLGDKTRLAHLITNLAELRLRVGLIAEAEQTLAFGRRVCGPVIPAARVAHFALVAARVHLSRGRTAEASAELASALASAHASSDGALPSDCHRLAARVALEDGDLARAARALASARGEASRPRAHAEVAVLEAARARAAGEPFEPLAREALGRARDADDRELSREAHALLAHAAREAGDPRAFARHLAAALALRDQTAASLPEPLRRGFLARRDLADLAALEAAPRAASIPPAPLAARATLPPPAAPGTDGDAALADAPDEPAAVAAAPESIPPPPPLPARPREARAIVGEAPAIIALLGAIRKVGPSDATVLITGESGTGKELVAEALHDASPRRGRPLVKVNCAALVETLLLSELFGHERGAFTNAVTRRRGRFELAAGGTLFLDEIGDISPRTQVALLRVLQEKQFERVGGSAPLRADVRVVCATHRDLPAMVERGEFREDLYYRLRGVVLEVPSLRERGPRDLALLANHLLARLSVERGERRRRLSPQALALAARYGWPGNVRELENALRAASLFAEGDAIEPADLLPHLGSEARRGARQDAAPASPASASATVIGPVGVEPAGIPAPPEGGDAGNGVDTTSALAYERVRAGTSLHDLKQQIEHACITRALEESGGNITRAAVVLGMTRSRLSQLVKQYGMGGLTKEKGGCRGEE